MTASDWVRAAQPRLKTDSSAFIMSVCVLVVYHVCILAVDRLCQYVLSQSQWMQ